MYVVDVIPLVFLPRNQDQILSYFHSEQLAFGTFVEAPLGARNIQAVVVSADPLHARKLTLRKATDFQLKNITKVLSAISPVEHWQADIAASIASRYYAPLGLSLKTVLPSFWGKRGYAVGPSPVQSAAETQSSHQPQVILTTDFSKRSADYRELITYNLSRGHQVFLLVPENNFAQYFAQAYADLDPTVLSSETKNKDYYQIWQQVQGGHSRLVIGTRVGLFLPFQKLGLLVIDDESHDAYKSDMTPRYHAVEVAREIARRHGAEVVIAAMTPRLETYAEAYDSISIGLRSNTQIIDMIREIKDGHFSVISRDLKEAMANAVAQNRKIILYVPRRGHANFILCQSCNNPIHCPECEASMVYHKLTEKIGQLICHHCAYKTEVPKYCPQCRSRSLKLYGLGTAGIQEKLIQLIEYDPRFIPIRKTIYILDKDATDTPAEQQNVMANFLTSGPAVLITTQLIFSHAHLLHVNVLGIINADALMHIPDFRSQERLFRQLNGLTSLADVVIVQTRNPQDPALQAITRPSTNQYQDFFTTELGYRRDFWYPPFSRIIRLTFAHTNPKKAKDESAIVYDKLTRSIDAKDRDNIEILPPTPAFIARERGKYVWHIIMKTSPSYEIKKRNQLLRVVPTGWTIDVDPLETI